MVGLLLGLYMMVVFTISSSAQELGNTDVRPTSEMLLRHDEPTVRLQVPEMVELQKLVQTQRWTDANLLAAEFVGKNPKEPKGYLWLGYVQLRQHERCGSHSLAASGSNPWPAGSAAIAHSRASLLCSSSVRLV